jgi:hypothetical protein
MGMAEETREDQYVIGLALSVIQAPLEDLGGHSVAQVMETRRASFERDALAQLPERGPNSAGTKLRSVGGHKEILGERKASLAMLSVSPQSRHRCRV